MAMTMPYIKKKMKPAEILKVNSFAFLNTETLSKKFLMNKKIKNSSNPHLFIYHMPTNDINKNAMTTPYTDGNNK